MLELPDKPSIAVLPFANMSGDPEQEYFSDGITEDIITELSRFRELFVIARNSTFRFKGQRFDIAEIAQQLGVQYIVEGSVRKVWKAGENYCPARGRAQRELRSGQTDTTGTSMTSSLYRMKWLLLLQAPCPVESGMPNWSERTAGPWISELMIMAQRAWQLMYQWTKTGVETATGLAERALEIEPKYGSAHAVLVAVQLLNWRRCWSESPEETLQLALKHGRSAVELDETEYTGHWYLSEAYLFRMKDLEQAKVHAERAIKLCPNASGPTAWMGFINGCSGEHQSGN